MTPNETLREIKARCNRILQEEWDHHAHMSDRAYYEAHAAWEGRQDVARGLIELIESVENQAVGATL